MVAEAGGPLKTPVTEKVKDFIARHVFHPLQGIARISHQGNGIGLPSVS
jgi:hypothetical protein